MSTEALALAAGILVLILAVVAALLLVSRAGLRARLDGSEDALARARGELDQARGRFESEAAQVSELSKFVETLRVEVTQASAERDAARGEAERARAAGEQRLSERLADKDREFAQGRDGAERLAAARLASVEQAKKEIEGKLAEFDEKFQKVFGSLAGQALKDASTQFLAMAEQKLEAKASAAAADMDKRRVAVDELVKPIAETLKRTHEKLELIEKDRAGAYSTLTEQVRSANETGRLLREETGKLVSALKRPEVRGRWGEIQLERVVEISGMKGYCDFATQASVRGSDGKLLRPDLTVNLPGGRVVAVDAKTNIAAYVEATEATTPEESEARLDRFAQHVSDQVGALSRKGYWTQYEGSPDFTVMFIPGDQFIDAAMARRPDLMEKAWEKGVILASPSTLIGLLRAIAVGWRERKLEDRAEGLFALGRELHDRAAVVAKHLSKLGEAMETAVGRYNEAAGSFQSRLTPTLRKFEEVDAKSGKELPDLPEITVRPRLLERVPGTLPSSDGNGA